MSRLLTLNGLPDRINGECAGFAWVGQHLRSCDICGEPYWEHKYDRQFVGDKESQVAITPERAAAVRAKWGPRDDSPPKPQRGAAIPRFYLATDAHNEPTIFTDLPDADATPVIRRVDLPDDVRHLWDELVRRVTA